MFLEARVVCSPSESAFLDAERAVAVASVTTSSIIEDTVQHLNASSSIHVLNQGKTRQTIWSIVEACCLYR